MIANTCKCCYLYISKQLEERKRKQHKPQPVKRADPGINFRHRNYWRKVGHY